MKTRIVLGTLLGCALLLGACKSTEETTAPMSQEDQLIEQHVAALGGRDQLATIESIEWTGSVDIPSMDMVLPLKLYQRRPNRMRSEVEVPMMGATVITGYDGETAWTINPMMGSGAQKLPPEQAKTTRQQADIDGQLVDYASKGLTIEYVGEEEVKGAPAHKLRLIQPDSSESFVFLDADSFLQVKAEGEGINPMDGSKVYMETYLSDYRAVHGVPMAHKVTVEMGGQVFQEVTLDEATVNTEMEDDLFAYPKK